MQANSSSLCILLLWIVYTSVVHGAIWPRTPGDASRPPNPQLDASSSRSPQHEVDALDVVSPAERNLIFRSLSSLDSFEHKSDCFKDAAGQLKVKCGEGMGEADRVQAAVRFTLCELATARQHSHPLECEPFALFDQETAADPWALSSCVEALSRSTQYWSSYSGYLREIPQLCFAYSRWHDIDRAKAIYHNATMEKLSLLQVLKQRESASREQDAVRQAAWGKSFSAFSSAVEQLHGIKTEILAASDEGRSTMETAEAHIRDGLEQMVLLLHQSLSEVRRDLQKTMEEAIRTTSQEVVVHAQGSMNSALDKFSIDLSASTVYQMEAELGRVMGSLLEGIMARSHETIKSMESLDISARTLTAALTTAQQLAIVLSGESEHLASQVQQATSALAEHSRLLTLSSDEAATLSNKLSQLATHTELQLGNLNATAHSVQESLVAGGSRAHTSSTLSWLSLWLSRLHPVLWQYAMHEPSFRAFWVFLQVMGQLGWFVLSSGAGWIFLFAQRYYRSHPQQADLYASDDFREQRGCPPSPRGINKPSPLHIHDRYQEQDYIPPTPRNIPSPRRPRTAHVARISPRLTTANLL